MRPGSRRGNIEHRQERSGCGHPFNLIGLGLHDPQIPVRACNDPPRTSRSLRQYPFGELLSIWIPATHFIRCELGKVKISIWSGGDRSQTGARRWNWNFRNCTCHRDPADPVSAFLGEPYGTVRSNADCAWRRRRCQREFDDGIGCGYRERAQARDRA